MISASDNKSNPTKILYFDGVCKLCNGFISFLIKRDKKKALYFSPLQSDQAQASLPQEHTIEPLSSLVYMRGGESPDHPPQIYTESTAALLAISELGWPYKIILSFLILPKFFRDTIYRIIAKNRYKIFGKSDACRVPTPEEASRFL